MAKYGLSFDNFATATSAKSAMGFDPNASGEEGELVELVMTGAGVVTPADTGHTARLATCTFGAAGTWVDAATPEQFHQLSRANNVLVTREASAEPTTVGSVYPLLWGFNQRGGMRWAVPTGEGYHVRNATAPRGAVFQVISSAVGAVDGHGHWLEP